MADSEELKEKFNESEPTICSFQRDQIYRMLEKARRDLQEANSCTIRRCPKCGYVYSAGGTHWINRTWFRWNINWTQDPFDPSFRKGCLKNPESSALKAGRQ